MVSASKYSMQEFFNDPRGVNVEWRNCYDAAQN